MRTLVRYLLVCGVILGLAVSAFVIRIDGRSLYGHIRHAGDDRFESVLADIREELDERLRALGEESEPPTERPKEPKKAKPTRNRPTPGKREATVEKIRQATSPRKVSKPIAKKKSTRTEDSITRKQEAALDRLLSQRLGSNEPSP